MSITGRNTKILLMGIFSIFKRRSKPTTRKNDTVRPVDELISGNNYLGKAAEAKHQARQAVKNGKYDKAWGFFQDQKMYYTKHASRSQFTGAQTLALDSQVHEDLANILRLEKKKHDALSHIVYWIIANNGAPIKRHEQKLRAYFNRCGFENTSYDDALKYSKSSVKLTEFDKARSKVVDWQSRG